MRDGLVQDVTEVDLASVDEIGGGHPLFALGKDREQSNRTCGAGNGDPAVGKRHNGSRSRVHRFFTALGGDHLQHLSVRRMRKRQRNRGKTADLIVDVGSGA